uniref:RBPJ-interacting and tubulin-associated protein 1 n=1 Tax=Biomphalaria glabrata TaxID=6526 RepID=A0A2C9KH17_BIOGL
MSNEDFVLTGSRPPSVLSNYRPNSAKQNGYHTIARKSSVDETLFRSYYTTKLDEPVSLDKPPWEYPHIEKTLSAKKSQESTKAKYNGPPLLWCPTPREVSHTKSKQKPGPNDPLYLWNTKHHYRHLKHTPSFIDETLFGSRLEEPSFKAPWNEKKKGEKIAPRPLLWGPPMKGQLSDTDVRHTVNDSFQRPSSARSTGRPVWKP